MYLYTVFAKSNLLKYNFMPYYAKMRCHLLGIIIGATSLSLTETLTRTCDRGIFFAYVTHTVPIEVSI